MAEFTADLHNQWQKKRVNRASGDQQRNTKADGVKMPEKIRGRIQDWRARERVTGMSKLNGKI